MQTVAETPIFSRQAAKLFDEEQKRELIDFLAANPEAGDEIPGTGGVRKVRFAASGRGKRGGGGLAWEQRRSGREPSLQFGHPSDQSKLPTARH